MAEFKGLTADTFATYSPEKWSSNVHNLARMKAKDLIVSLCNRAAGDLAAELQGLSYAVSDDVPNITNHKKVDAQWVYWFRDAEARKSLKSFLEKTPLDSVKLFDIAPQDKHLTLAVIVREKEIWVGLRLAPGAAVDRKNLMAVLEKDWEREQLVGLLKELPEGALIGHENALRPAFEVSKEQLAELIGKMGENDPAWQLGHAIPAKEAIDLGPELADHVGRWLGALVPHYCFIAWTKDNDHIGIIKQIQEEKAQKRRQALGFKTGDKVRVVGGMFSGKVGVVQDIDSKAQCKLSIGKMTVVIPGSDLTPMG